VPVISKKDKTDLRYAPYQVALPASRLTSVFRAYYSRLLEGRQREKGLRIKMLVIAWTLMRRKEPFNPAIYRIGHWLSYRNKKNRLTGAL
jgi:hypothetical protein